MTSRTNYYKTVTQIFSFDEHKDDDKPEQQLNVTKKEPFYVDESYAEEHYKAIKRKKDKETAKEVKKVGNDPKVFGPPLWFSLHNASAYYPENAAPLHAERMKNIIIGLPVLIPCETCKEHATNYIEENKHLLMDICKTKKDVFKFFVDFHNYVNERLGKKKFSYEEAHNLYH